MPITEPDQRCPSRLELLNFYAAKRGLTCEQAFEQIALQAEAAWVAQQSKQPCVVLPFRRRSA